MKIKLFLSTVLIFLFASCEKPSNEHHHEGHDDAITEESPNQALYNEVMKIHDDVMPKMGDIQKKKRELKKQLQDSVKLTEQQKTEIQAHIARLDSAGDSMMDWMHEFNPIPDSLGEEKAREYLENEMERIKRVRARMLEVLEEK